VDPIKPPRRPVTLFRLFRATVPALPVSAVELRRRLNRPHLRKDNGNFFRHHHCLLTGKERAKLLRDRPLDVREDFIPIRMPFNRAAGGFQIGAQEIIAAFFEVDALHVHQMDCDDLVHGRVCL